MIGDIPIVSSRPIKIRDLKVRIVDLAGFWRVFLPPMFEILRCQRRRLRCPSREAGTIHWECRTDCGGVSVTAVRADGDENQFSNGTQKAGSRGFLPLARRSTPRPLIRKIRE